MEIYGLTGRKFPPIFTFGENQWNLVRQRTNLRFLVILVIYEKSSKWPFWLIPGCHRKVCGVLPFRKAEKRQILVSLRESGFKAIFFQKWPFMIFIGFLSFCVFGKLGFTTHNFRAFWSVVKAREGGRLDTLSKLVATAEGPDHVWDWLSLSQYSAPSLIFWPLESKIWLALARLFQRICGAELVRPGGLEGPPNRSKQCLGLGLDRRWAWDPQLSSTEIRPTWFKLTPGPGWDRASAAPKIFKILKISENLVF